MTRTRPRPFIRRHTDGYWRIFLGRTDYVIGDYFTTAARAADAARTMWKGHR